MHPPPAPAGVRRISSTHAGFDVLAKQPQTKKLFLLAIFYLSLLLDTFNNSLLFTAIPAISIQLNIPNSQSVWLLSAYQLTFAALLLVVNYHAAFDLGALKWVFVAGALLMDVFALVGGFIRKEIPLIISTALTASGAGGALTIPSALHLIAHMYPDPATQVKAVTAFGGLGATGIVLGLIIGALFVSYASWPWVFYFSAAVSAVIESRAEQILRFRRLDLLGVFTFTAASILFIFSIISVLAPLIMSLFLFVLFFVWEARLPESYAAVPSKMWSYENFTVLIAISVASFMWWGSIFLLFSWFWEVVYGWSAIKTAVHFLPGLGIFSVLPLAAGLQCLKWTALLPLADFKDHYWCFAFPGFLLGTAGAALIYTATNVALLANTPRDVSGIVSAMFTCVLQKGGAGHRRDDPDVYPDKREASHGGPTAFTRRTTGLWFLLAFLAAVGVLLLGRMKDTVGPVNPDGPDTKADSTDMESSTHHTNLYGSTS
ncbi:major facilitator superfamily-domain-containing protein [Mycena latifolia]|nr:major facilitator superfamily-domain-containing protein [Mycena latifolia]